MVGRVGGYHRLPSGLAQKSARVSGDEVSGGEGRSLVGWPIQQAKAAGRSGSLKATIPIYFSKRRALEKGNGLQHTKKVNSCTKNIAK